MPIRVLLDQNAPLGLRRVLAAYEVMAARDLGWATLTNGDLISTAEAAGFTILITCDRNIRYQQNLTGRRIALIELTTGAWPIVWHHVERIAASIAAVKPGSYTIVSILPAPLRRRPWPRPQ
jgi:hypothetical protein